MQYLERPAFVSSLLWDLLAELLEEEELPEVLQELRAEQQLCAGWVRGAAAPASHANRVLRHIRSVGWDVVELHMYVRTYIRIYMGVDTYILMYVRTYIAVAMVVFSVYM